MSNNKKNFTSFSSIRNNQIDHNDELTDDESEETMIDHQKIEEDYVKLFEKNKNQILQVLPNLKVGMDLSKVIYYYFSSNKKKSTN